MPVPLLHLHYRSFITTTNRSAPYTSPNHGCRFPLSIWPISIEFTCSLKWPVLRSCQLYPGCGVASIFRTSATLITDTNVTTCFSHHRLRFRGFIVGSFSFSSTVLTYRDHCPRFSLTVHHTSVSAKCSVRRFDGCSGRPPSEGLPMGSPIVLHPFQSIQPPGADSSHTRFAAWRRRALGAVRSKLTPTFLKILIFIFTRYHPLYPR